MSTAAKLAEAIGRKLDRREVADVWRCGIVWRWSPPMGQFCQTLVSETVRPGESLAHAEREAGGFIAILD